MRLPPVKAWLLYHAFLECQRRDFFISDCRNQFLQSVEQILVHFVSDPVTVNAMANKITIALSDYELTESLFKAFYSGVLITNGEPQELPEE